MKNFINFLTFSRIFSAILISLFLLKPETYFAALIIFCLAGITDYFDGYLARKHQLTSDLGEILDPISDKILIVFILITLSIILKSFYIAFLSAFIISREIWVAALRDYNARNNNLYATKVTYIAKIKTTIQFITIFIYLVGINIDSMLVLVVADIFLLISFLITWYTGYMYTIKTFKDSN